MPRVVSSKDKEYESWQSAIAGLIHIKQFDQRGELTDVMVPSGKQFFIKPDERRINQEMCISDDFDPFVNGQFVPVRLIDGDFDTAALRANPNVLSEDAIKGLLGNGMNDDFQSTVDRITNPITLNRILEVARQVDASISQVDLVASRLNEVATGPKVNEVETVITETGREAVRTRAPKSDPPPNPSGGRRGKPLS